MSTALVAIVTAVSVSAPLDKARAWAWPDREYEQLQAEPAPPPGSRRIRPLPQRLIVGHKLGHHTPKGQVKQASAPQHEAKPHGPLVIAISIAKQHLRIYDQDGLFAESPVSTGMRGHPTPMGVFSVIQKSKYHRSNIYSGAPMPYMQRITWSGVAMHAGVLPGYPASHGCIRMPMAFAVKLWGWSKLGARVIIAPEDVTPASIAHPVLMTRANPAQPAQSSPPAAPAAGAAAKTATSDKTGHADGATPSDEPRSSPEQAPLRPAMSDRVRLADADPGLPTAPAPSPDGGPENAAAPVAPSPATKAAASSEGAVRSTAEFEPAKAPAPTAAETTKAPAQEQGATPPASAPPAPRDTTSTGTPANNATATKRSGHVAALISRKAARLYVRQNFEPWFDVPLTIGQDDHPLGTHVFTAIADPAEPGSLRWTVVSLPQLPKRRDTAQDTPRRANRPAPAADTEAAPPPAPAEVLDRVTIPADAAAKIAAALAPGDSIIVSDQGLGDETGIGTDFIVPLR